MIMILSAGNFLEGSYDLDDEIVAIDPATVVVVSADRENDYSHRNQTPASEPFGQKLHRRSHVTQPVSSNVLHIRHDSQEDDVGSCEQCFKMIFSYFFKDSQQKNL